MLDCLVGDLAALARIRTDSADEYRSESTQIRQGPGLHVSSRSGKVGAVKAGIASAPRARISDSAVFRSASRMGAQAVALMSLSTPTGGSQNARPV
jgi:hypothetical protein